MTAKRRGLGRGLDALLGEVEIDPRRDRLQTLPIESLKRNRYQPRKEIDPERLQELADSISAQGVVQPIVVRPDGENYEIIAGERRWRAAQMAGLHEIPVVLREVSDQGAMAMALIENIQREDLNPLEQAEMLQRLLGQFDMTHQQVADSVGKARVTVTNLLRLTELHADVKQFLRSGELEMGHGRALLGLEHSTQIAAAKKVVAQGLSVRATEKLVRSLQREGEVRSERERVDPDVERLQTRVAERLGARVQIKHGKNGKGKLIVSYSSLDQLEGILDRIH